MDGAASIAAASRAREASERDRERRHDIVRSARRARRTSRHLREVSSHSRDRALSYRWEFWSAGYLSDAPSYFPTSWERQALSDAEVLAATARECEHCAAAVRRVAARGGAGDVRRLPALAALCSVAAERIAADGETEILLSACARMLVEAEHDLGRRLIDPEVVALAASCRSTALQIRKALARLYALEVP